MMTAISGGSGRLEWEAHVCVGVCLCVGVKLTGWHLFKRSQDVTETDSLVLLHQVIGCLGTPRWDPEFIPKRRILSCRRSSWNIKDLVYISALFMHYGCCINSYCTGTSMVDAAHNWNLKKTKTCYLIKKSIELVIRSSILLKDIYVTFVEGVFSVGVFL